MKKQSLIYAKMLSLPVREVWIEISVGETMSKAVTVTSREGSVD